MNRTKLESLLDKAIALSEALADLDNEANHFIQEYHQKKQVLEIQLDKVMRVMFTTRKKEWSGKLPNNHKRQKYTV